MITLVNVARRSSRPVPFSDEVAITSGNAAGCLLMAFVVAAMAGFGWIVGGSLAFALIRALSMYASSAAVRSGTLMAERGAVLSRVESRVVRSAAITVVCLSLIAIAGPWR